MPTTMTGHVCCASFSMTMMASLGLATIRM